MIPPSDSRSRKGERVCHFPEAVGQAGNQLLLDAEGDGQVGVLVRGVDGAAHEEIDVGRVFKQLAGNQARAVLLGGPDGGQLRLIQKVLGVGEHLGEGNHALGGQIDALDAADGRHVGVVIVQRGDDGLAQVAGDDVAGGAAADDLGALFGKEEVHHAHVVLLVLGAGRPRGSPGWRLRTRTTGHGGIIARRAAVEAVAFVDDEAAVNLALFSGR